MYLSILSILYSKFLSLPRLRNLRSVRSTINAKSQANFDLPTTNVKNKTEINEVNSQIPIIAQPNELSNVTGFQENVQLRENFRPKSRDVEYCKIMAVM
ncbi:hypothetical protein WICMUC_005731 [Wickerhamomyces mucosus]|uniref:Uncharacterized protein n=1 Tax=Wickerhamomyces mucosus TaxID=1378264 RepID=A0A9P8P3G3_9ASCO|nr:hypothetical protein WICMUC_005731 [Wickerhamomyces mucosus]